MPATFLLLNTDIFTFPVFPVFRLFCFLMCYLLTSLCINVFAYCRICINVMHSVFCTTYVFCIIFLYSVLLPVFCTTFLYSVLLSVFCTTFCILYYYLYSVLLFCILYYFVYSVLLPVFCTTFLYSLLLFSILYYYLYSVLLCITV
jgi:hypothetical protein